MLLSGLNLFLSIFADAQELVHLSLVRLVNEQELVLRDETLEAHVAVVLMREEGSRLLVLVTEHLDRLVHELFLIGFFTLWPLQVVQTVFVVLDDLKLIEVLVVVQVLDHLIGQYFLAVCVKIFVGKLGQLGDH